MSDDTEADTPAGPPRTMGEYADRWLADLLDPIDAGSRRMIVQTMAINWMGGPLPDRESVQRLLEAHQANQRAAVRRLGHELRHALWQGRP
ncbi:MAG TPA: hypothetical protein VIJ18_05505 [Microbacteriaceae bacterium]